MAKHLNDCYEPNELERRGSEPEKFCKSQDFNRDELDNLFNNLSNKNKKTGLGKANKCDPQTTGKIYDDDHNRDVIYRYARSLRACDEAVLDMFNDLQLIDENGGIHKVPIIWGSQEKAVAAVFQENVRKDNSLVVDRIRLPIMALYSTGVQPQADRYTYHKALDLCRRLRPDGKPGLTDQEKYPRDTIFGVSRGIPVDISYLLTGWVLYHEDKLTLLEQIYPRIFPMGILKIPGIFSEVILKLNDMSDNTDREPGDVATRVIKFDINMTAETYISQPIVRKKAILSEKIDLVDGIEEDDIEGIISTLRITP